MGTAHVLVNADLRMALYDHPAKHGIQVIGDTPWDNYGLRLLRVLSDKLSPGENGMQSVVVEEEKYRFVRDEPGYES